MAAEASGKIPYLSAYGNITKVLDKIKTASVPDRFTVDFLATKLGMAGGAARPLIPYLKRAGFLGPDGSPTQLYRQFRNQALSGAAAARALRNAYPSLYELNEYAHEASDAVIKGLVVQVTGMEPDSSKALKAYADFDASLEAGDVAVPVPRAPENGVVTETPPMRNASTPHLNLGYTINLQLPNTTDVAVFNAIFKSLREHLLS